MQCATHAGILSSVVSTTPFGMASLTSGTLSYPSQNCCTEYRVLSAECWVFLRTGHSVLSTKYRVLWDAIASVGGLIPGGLSAPAHIRPVIYYELFKGWLLLSQPPGCLCEWTSFTT